jgi:two-component system chemotaxis response regulator CheY
VTALTVRVLVVEDSSAMRAFVRATLESDGDYEVTEAASGFEALRVLPRATFDLAVLDINMPDINGLELISFMRKTDAHKQTPLIVISTEASDRDRSRALELGANAFVPKPFTPEDLLAAVSRLLSSTASGG